MNLNSPMATAILRSLYLALGSGAFVFLATWASTDELKAPAIAAGMAALSAMGFRGGVEGGYDAKRQRKGDVKASDVGQ